MLRIIVRTDDASMAANVGGNVHTTYCTLDVSAPEVETFMREKLGLYVERRIVGVEVIDGVGGLSETALRDPVAASEERFYALAERRGWDTTADPDGGQDFADERTQEHWQAWLAGVEHGRTHGVNAPANWRDLVGEPKPITPPAGWCINCGVTHEGPHPVAPHVCGEQGFGAGDNCPACASGVLGMTEAQATPIRGALRDVQEMWDELHRRGLNLQLMRRYSDAISVLEKDFLARLPDGVQEVPRG